MDENVIITNLDDVKKHPELHTVWISEEKKIVSFHDAEDFEKRDFPSYDSFFIALQAYQLRGFRFQ